MVGSVTATIGRVSVNIGIGKTEGVSGTVVLTLGVVAQPPKGLIMTLKYLHQKVSY
jgi:hypothetical protein